MIEMRGVTFGYGRGRPVLAGVDLTIGPGLTLVVGPNGSGKSSLLKLAAGVEAPERGEVWVDGADLWRDEVEARRGLAYVPEQPDLTPYATLGEVLDLVCRLRGEPRQRGGEALARLGLGGFTRRSVRELSLGQRRRALLAAARIGAPRHVLLDEPLESLDVATRDDVMAWIDGLVAAGAAVVAVSHDLEPFAARAVRAMAPATPATPATTGTVLSCELPAGLAERLAVLDGLARGTPAPAAAG
jgi:ABC-type multidrug transport system ATPase subunit